MVRHSRSKLQGILEAPGFHGYPTGGNMESGYSSVATEHQKPFEIPSARIMPKLNNGRRWVHPGDAMPTHREDAYRHYSNSLTRMNATPLSKTYTETDKANNPETAAVMNPHSVPFYGDLADAQKQADVQRALGDASHSEQYGHKPSLAEMKEAKMVIRKGMEEGFARLSHKKPVDENIDISFATAEQDSLIDFFQRAGRVRDQEMIANLASKGFTEEEVRGYMEKRRERDIDKAAKEPISDMFSIEKALLAMRSSHTGTNATGIVALGATQNQNVYVSALKNEDRPGMYRHLAHNVAPPASWGQPASEIDEVQSVQASEYPSSAASMMKTMARGRSKSKKTILPGQSTLSDYIKPK